MSASFEPGDFLAFQLESGFGLIRVLRVDVESERTVWHVLVYNDLFPDIESAEASLVDHHTLVPTIRHAALTDRAFERTPAARLGNAPLSDDEMAAYNDWTASVERPVFDRSVLQMIGIR